MRKILSSILLLSLGFGLSSCGKEPTKDASKTEVKTTLETLNIGYQKASLKFIVAKKNKVFEKAFPNTKIEWKEFPAGPPTLEALTAGSIDVGYTGDTPIIFALSAAKPIEYLGYEINSKNAHSVLLPKDSKIQNLQDLKGKRIALTQGSSAHFFLAEVLKKANLTWQDVQPVWLTPADARAALDKKSIDAWVIWDPYSSAATLQGDTRTLIDASKFPPAYSFYSSNPKFLQKHASEAKQLINNLNEVDQWINAHPEEATKILAESTGLDLKVATKVMEHRNVPSKVQLLDPETVQVQQNIADLFTSLKIIPTTVVLKDHVWNGGGK